MPASVCTLTTSHASTRNVSICSIFMSPPLGPVGAFREPPLPLHVCGIICAGESRFHSPGSAAPNGFVVVLHAH